MKLYIWFGVLCDYTCGMVAVIANSEDEAREVIRSGKLVKEIGTGEAENSEPWERESIGVPGPPNAVLDGPSGAFVWGGG